MLQPDEIIQQKEWHQLSADEKELLAELADDEAGYNLLKKMLMVSSEAVKEVPAVNEDVYRQIKKVFPGSRRQTSRKYWYATAAAAILLILSVFFIFKEQDRGGYVIKPAGPVEVKPAGKEILPAKKDSSSFMAEKKPVRKTEKNRQKVQPVFPSLQQDEPQQYVAVNTSVSANAGLLDLVSEVE